VEKDNWRRWSGIATEGHDAPRWLDHGREIGDYAPCTLRNCYRCRQVGRGRGETMVSFSAIRDFRVVEEGWEVPLPVEYGQSI
jgi:hypothetical protein